MIEIHQASFLFRPGAALEALSLATALRTPAELAPVADKPDARIYLLAPSGEAVAHAALWWPPPPAPAAKRAGIIGGFDALDQASALRLLEGAFERLREANREIALGPMNGSIWRRHRFMVESDGTSPFALEPRNPPAHPLWWEAAGFTPALRYCSSGVALDGSFKTSENLRRRLARAGVTVRPLDPAHYERDIHAMHAVSLKSFAGNPFFTSLSAGEFLEICDEIRNQVGLELILFAEKDGAVCGFVFAVSDGEATARGEKPSIIVRSLAVDPAARCPGLGSLLVDEAQRRALERGFSEAIHALHLEDNASRRITDRHRGHVMRRYALYARPL